MIYRKSIFLLFVFILFCLGSCQCYQKNVATNSDEPWADVVAYAKQKLSTEGELVQQEDGYAYLKVDDAYIHDLFPKLGRADFSKPPYFRRKDAPGAHISIVYADEGVRLKEAGQKYRFTLKKIAMVNPKKDVSYIVLELDAPSLEKLRESYGLSPKLKGHEFHISLAKKQQR